MTGEAGDFLLVATLMLPVAGVAAALLLGARQAERVVLCAVPAGLALALLVAARVWSSGGALAYLVGGWAPPLGVALRADGISAVMLVCTAVVIGAAALFARPQYGGHHGVSAGQPETRARLVFWVLLLGVWGGLNAVFLGADLFNLYVAIELLTFAAVPLVCLSGQPEALAPALRYLLFALFGSALYLLGAVLLYGAFGTLDIALLAGRVRAEPATWVAAGLITTGLLAKTALFPLHVWLPPAHAAAPPAASAVLSALVVKASFFIIVRLWFDVLPGVANPIVGPAFATLGAAAILYGGVMALRQARLKLLVAYSTVAQIGYLFVFFPLAGGPAASAASAALAWAGGWKQLLTHALAKAAMFMAAGLIAESLGHDRVAELRGAGRAVPLSVAAFGLGGACLVGLSPAGGFVAKLLLPIRQGQWAWGVVILVGGALAVGYLARVLVPALAGTRAGTPTPARLRLGRQMLVLALAIGAMLIGFAPSRAFDLLQIGRPTLSGEPAPPTAVKDPLP